MIGSASTIECYVGLRETVPGVSETIEDRNVGRCHRRVSSIHPIRDSERSSCQVR